MRARWSPFILLFMVFFGCLQPQAPAPASEAPFQAPVSSPAPNHTALNFSMLSDSNASAALTGPPSGRLARLARGVSITRWFIHPARNDDAYFSSYLSDPQLDWLRAKNFTVLRLAVQYDLISNASDSRRPNARMLAHLRQAVSRINARGLAAVVDIHDVNMTALEREPAYAGQFVAFWSALAANLSDTPPGLVFLEIANEPVYYARPSDWADLQARLARAIRQAAPEHTLIASGPAYSNLYGLAFLEPLGDSNAVYTFHFYEPKYFTHQGASWLGPELGGLKNLPYPYDEPACAKAANATSFAASRALAGLYCLDAWDGAKINRTLAVAVLWRNTYHRPLWLGEFGAYSPSMPPASKQAWLTDVRQAAEGADIPWSVWGYDDAFGLGVQPDAAGTPVPEPGVLAALGLPAP